MVVHYCEITSENVYEFSEKVSEFQNVTEFSQCHIFTWWIVGIYILVIYF